MTKYEWIGLGVFIAITLGVVMRVPASMGGGLRRPPWYIWIMFAVVGIVTYAAFGNK